MKKVNESIYNAWLKIPLPKREGNRSLLRHKNTNLWFFKGFNEGFGFLITGTMKKLSATYKNIEIGWSAKLTEERGGNTLFKCLVVESTNRIDSELFCSAISYLFEKNEDNKVFSAEEIEEALLCIEEITLQEREAFNAVVGAWGELFVINTFLENTINEKGKAEIVEAWEGLNQRSKIDFNFKTKKTKVEVKTTTEPLRLHHFNGFEQLSRNGCNLGVVASLCIYSSEQGLSCFDLVNSIKKKLPIKCVSTFDKKLKLRGKECLDIKHQFELSVTRDLEFFDFSVIPQPSIEPGISSIEWSAVLDNKKSLGKRNKNNLIRFMN
jgi:hypothetical protein